MKLSFVFLATLISQAIAKPPRDPGDRLARVKDFTVVGDGCPEKSSGRVKYLDETIVTLIFDKFRVFNVPGNGDNRTTTIGCQVDIHLSYPKCLDYSTMNQAIRGDMKLDKTASAKINVALTMIEDNGEKWDPEPVSLRSPTFVLFES